MIRLPSQVDQVGVASEHSGREMPRQSIGGRSLAAATKNIPGDATFVQLMTWSFVLN